MPVKKEPAIVRCSRVLYRRLLVFYSPELSRKFGEEMTDVFVALLFEATDQGNRMEVVHLWRSALWELLTVAAPSRLASNEVMAGALSLLASAALFLLFFRAVT